MKLPLFNPPLIIVVLGFLLSAIFSFGTTVVPPEPDELIGRADWIATGVVTSVRCEWRENSAGRQIFTIVTFKLLDRWVGLPSDSVDLVFLGGEIDGRGTHVAGQPEFEVGMQQLLFIANNGRQLCPVVRMGYGRFHLERDQTDPKALRVARDDHSPLTGLDQVAHPFRDSAHEENVTSSSGVTDRRGLSVTLFRELVTTRARALGRKDVHTVTTQVP